MIAVGKRCLRRNPHRRRSTSPPLRLATPSSLASRRGGVLWNDPSSYVVFADDAPLMVSLAAYMVRSTLDRIVYIDVADQHPDSMRFVKDCSIMRQLAEMGLEDDSR